MNESVSAFDHADQSGYPATRPIAGLPGRLAALLLMKPLSEGLSRQKTAAKSLLILAGTTTRVVAPCQTTRQTHTRTRPTEVSRMNAVRNSLSQKGLHIDLQLLDPTGLSS